MHPFTSYNTGMFIIQARITEAKESFYCSSKIIRGVHNNHERLILLALWQITYLCARSSKRKARRNYSTAANRFVFTYATLHPLGQVLDSQSLLTAGMMSLRGQMRINHMSKSQTKTGNVSARIKKANTLGYNETRGSEKKNCWLKFDRSHSPTSQMEVWDHTTLARQAQGSCAAWPRHRSWGQRSNNWKQNFQQVPILPWGWELNT